MATRLLTYAEAAALWGQQDKIVAGITYPMLEKGISKQPDVERTTFERNLVRLAAGIPLVDVPDGIRHLTYYDDFFEYDATATVGNWVAAVDAGSTAALADAAGGWLTLATDGGENDGTVVASTFEIFDVVSAKPLYFEAYVKPAEGSTNINSWFVGLSDVVTVDLIVDAGATMAASIDAIGFLKIRGGLTYNFTVCNGATQTSTVTVGTMASGTAVRLGFKVEPYMTLAGAYSATKARITPYVNGVAGTALDALMASFDAMQIVFAQKTGGSSGDALAVDYVQVAQAR